MKSPRKPAARSSPFRPICAKTATPGISSNKPTSRSADITAYVAKESWVKANPDVARRFKSAVDRATTHLVNASKEECDDWVAKYTGARPEVVTALNLPEFTTEFNVSTPVPRLVRCAIRHGSLGGVPQPHPRSGSTLRDHRDTSIAHCTPSLADFITITCGFRFSVHTLAGTLSVRFSVRL
jgi:hypothetical protein